MDDTTRDATGSDPSGFKGQDPAPSGSASSSTGPDEAFGWTAGDDDSAPSGADTRPTAERMLSQLQSMIDAIATQAAPVVRQIGVKAAELAAVAADRAGPLAHKAADATADASERLAERSRTWAADLRNRAAEDGDADGSAVDAETDSRASTAVDATDDALGGRSHDDPVEGSPA